MGRIADFFGRSKTVVLAVVVAVVLVGALADFAANGNPFILGKKNTATKVSSLVKSGSGPALSLVVGLGTPLAVNSAVKVVNLNIVQCMGVNATGTAPVFNDAANFVYATCSCGDSYDAGHVTQVSLQRSSGDNVWVGTMLSTYNQ